MSTTDPELKAALERIFATDSELYQGRGFQRRVGYGERPALIIDLANAWTRPGNAFSCDNMDEIIPAVQRLNETARPKGIPIIYTTTAFDVVEGPNSDMGIWNRKIPLEELKVGTEAVQIDSASPPSPGSWSSSRSGPARFTGRIWRRYLTAHRVDTVVVTGVTMAGCTRHTVEDAISEGFRPIVVREAVGDRVPGVVEWNLFDIEAKFGDVEPLSNVLAYLERLPTA